MSDPYVGEIRAVGYNFAPTGWAQCNGQLLAISQNTALFSLLGTAYGGNGTSNFGLPNLQGNVTISQGQSLVGQLYDLGETGGASQIALSRNESPGHTHNLMASISLTDVNTAVGNVLGRPEVAGNPN